MNINEKFNLENAYILANLCKVVYKDKFCNDIKKSEYFRFFNTDGIQVLIYGDKIDLFVIFRGSDEISDWLSNFKIRQENWLDYGKIHIGFKESFHKVVFYIESYLREILLPTHNLWITGHSLGGSLAMLMACYIKYIKLTNNFYIYTFGSPRLGNKRWAYTYQLLLADRTYRIVNGNDIVSRVPSRWLNYYHPNKTLVYIETNGKIDVKNNYLTLLKCFRDRASDRLCFLPHDIKDDHKIDSYIINLEKNLKKGIS